MSARAADVEFLVDLGDIALDAGASQVQTGDVELALSLPPGNEVVGHVRERVHASGEPVLRHVREAELPNLPRAEAKRVSAAYPYPALDGGAHAGDGLEQLALAVALDGGNAEHLARAGLKTDAADGDEAPVVANGEVFDGYHGFPRHSGLLQLVEEHRPAHHHGGYLLFRDVLCV